MIRIIARKEMTEMLRDGRFRWAGGIMLVLLLAAVALGWQHYREVKAQHEAAKRASREQWVGQGTKNPHSAAHYGVYAFKPKMPLSLVDRGLDPWMGVAVWLEAHKQNEFTYRPAQDSTVVQRFGELTGATVLQLLVPLLIVLLTFSAFSGEREQGTLRQLLSLGVRRSDLLLGKAAGIASAFALLLIPSTVLGVAALALSSENGAFRAGSSRMILMGLGYMLYFAVFLGVSLAASAWIRSSRVVLVTLLGFWIFNGLIAPRAVSDLAKSVYRTPSAFEFAHQIERGMKQGLDGHNPADKRRQDLLTGLLKKYNVDRAEALPVNFAGLALQEGEEYGNKVFDKYYSQLWDTFHRQERVHQAAAVLAPALAVRSLSMGLAGTDFAQHAHFARAAEEYRRLIQREMNLDIAYNAKESSRGYVRGRSFWEKLPDFEYTAPGLSWVLARLGSSLLLLLGWALAASGAALAATRALRVD